MTFLESLFGQRITRDVEPSLTISNTVLSSDAYSMAELFGSGASVSGSQVTKETAMRVSAVYACVRLICGSVAVLPAEVYKRKSNGERELTYGDDVWWLLNEQANPRWTSASMMEWMLQSVLLRGDGFAWLWRPNGSAVAPKEIWPLHPDSVAVERRGNSLYYEFTEDGKTYGAEASDILHLPGFGFDGIRSMSALKYGARNAIGIAQAADEHSGAFYQGGATSRYVFKSPKSMTQAQRDALRNQFLERYTGAGNASLPLVLTEGMDVESISMTAEDAQLLEARKFQVEEIARAYGVPPFMIGATDKTTSWGSGVEQMGRGYLLFTLLPHLKRFQQEMNRKFFRTAGKFVEFDVDELARADMATRSKADREAIGGSMGPGWETIDEVRRRRKMAPLGGGASELYRPENTSAEPTATISEAGSEQ